MEEKINNLKILRVNLDKLKTPDPVRKNHKNLWIDNNGT